MTRLEDLRNRTAQALSDQVVNEEVNKLKTLFIKNSRDQAKKGYNRYIFIIGGQSPQQRIVHDKFLSWLKSENIEIENVGLKRNKNISISVNWK